MVTIVTLLKKLIFCHKRNPPLICGGIILCFTYNDMCEVLFIYKPKIPTI